MGAGAVAGVAGSGARAYTTLADLLPWRTTLRMPNSSQTASTTSATVEPAPVAPGLVASAGRYQVLRSQPSQISGT